ncbi:spore coat protein [Ruminococcaceae bacterium OttesenSCG-928-L11]|nr:spore coat protein [Ruminococcaceae bacterium OttesenSCG-928-L11]
MELNQQSFCDKDILTDLLSSQKFVTDGYNSFANECATPAVKTDFVNLLSEEHQLQNEVFCEMQKRGWYQVEAAEQTKINQAKQKYTASSL